MTTADSPRTRVRRLPDRQVRDRSILDDLLDAVPYCHVGVSLPDGVHVLPMAHARDGDQILLHGSTGSRLMRALAEGVPACLTVTEVTGIVVARSGYESSMHYRSAMVYGTCSVIPRAEIEAAAARLTDALIPGRVAEIRRPTARELAATMILSLPLTEWALKVGAKEHGDPPEDHGKGVWAGVVPLVRSAGPAVPADPESAGLPVPASVRALIAGERTGP